MKAPTAQQERKRALRAFFINYTDERLAMLLAHARDGKLAYGSCCCFIGIATADHALQPAYCADWHAPGSIRTPVRGALHPHLQAARYLPHANEAESAFRDVGGMYALDRIRQRFLIPMIRAEMKRREKLHAQVSEAETIPALQEVAVGR